MMATILPESGRGVVRRVKRWPNTSASSSVGLNRMALIEQKYDCMTVTLPLPTPSPKSNVILAVEEVGLVVQPLTQRMAAVLNLVVDLRSVHTHKNVHTDQRHQIPHVSLSLLPYLIDGLLVPPHGRQPAHGLPPLLPVEHRAERPRVDGAVARAGHLVQGPVVHPGDVRLSGQSRETTSTLSIALVNRG